MGTEKSDKAFQTVESALTRPCAGGPKDGERRLSDRRRRPTPMLSRYTFTGRRRANRRNTDPQKNYYVDRPRLSLLFIVAAIFVLGGLDAFFTYRLLGGGAVEANPVMNFFLGLGWPVCAFVKVVVCGAALLILLLHQNFYKMPYVLGSICSFYGLLIGYEVYLLQFI